MATESGPIPPGTNGSISPEERRVIVAALEAGRLEEAEARCRPLLERADNLDALLLMACIRSAQGQHDVALGLFGDLVEIVPYRADITYNQGSALRRAGRLADAVEAWRRTLRLRPDLIAARHNLAMALRELGDLAGAIEAFETLLELSPESEVEALLQIGNLNYLSGDIEAAISRYRTLVNHHPGAVMGWTNLGQGLKEVHKYDEAERSYRRALEVDPSFDLAAFNLGCLLLSEGRWREGFTGYERRKSRHKRPAVLADLPPWQGDEPPGTIVALWHDQGFGDAIQFVRFAAAIAARGHHPVLLIGAPLRRLLATAPGLVEVRPAEEPLPPFGAEVALASLPYRLGLETSDSLWSGPYLTAPTGPVPALPAARKRVGLVWAGAVGYVKDRARSLTLEDLAPLFAVPEVAWISLQLGPHAADREGAPWPSRIFDATASLNDFAATATLIEQLDLVVTVDTAVAHLAGALGRPAWVLLRDEGDWRWGREGEETPWYPSLRLFRQTVPGRWEEPVQAIAAALAELPPRTPLGG